MFLFFSCYRPGPSRFLDVEKHNEMLKKWKELNIKNYSFTYSFLYGYSFPYYEVIGNVTVKDGKGKVVFKDKEWEHKLDNPDLKDSYYSITNIEDAFKHILDSVYSKKSQIIMILAKYQDLDIRVRDKNLNLAACIMELAPLIS